MASKGTEAMTVLGLLGQLLVVEGGTTGLSSVRSHEKLPLYPTESNPAGSKRGLLLAKAETSSDGSNASVITYLRGKKKLLC